MKSETLTLVLLLCIVVLAIEFLDGLAHESLSNAQRNNLCGRPTTK